MCNQILCVGLWGAVSYLLGSIPTAVWLGRRFYGVDVRSVGSGNAGATNVLRTFGWRAALPVLLVDAAKGAVAVMLANVSYAMAGADSMAADMIIVRIAYGMLAVVGHMYPVFAGFRGGKGVATLLGVSVALCPVVALAALLTFICVFAMSRIVSLSSLCAGVGFALTGIVLHSGSVAMCGFVVFVCMLLFYTHRRNIVRLWHGNESKIVWGKH